MSSLEELEDLEESRDEICSDIDAINNRLEELEEELELVDEDIQMKKIKIGEDRI